MQGTSFLLLTTKSKSWQMSTTNCNMKSSISSDRSWKYFEEIYVTEVLQEGIRGWEGGGGGVGVVVPDAKHPKLVFFTPC